MTNRTMKSECETTSDIDAAQAKIAWRLKLWAMSERFIKRLEQAIFVLRNMQSAEALSAVSAICVAVPLASNPTFFSNAPYFAQLAHYISEPVCMWFFLVLAVLQLFGLVLGAEPPAFPEDGKIKALWLRYRITLLIFAAGMWGAVAYLCNANTLTFWGCWCWFVAGSSGISVLYLMLVQLKPTMIRRERYIRNAARGEASAQPLVR